MVKAAIIGVLNSAFFALPAILGYRMYASATVQLHDHRVVGL